MSYYKKSVIQLFGYSIIFLLSSCSNDTNVATFTTSYGNFTNSLLIEGYTEPVQFIPIICPYFTGGMVDGIVEYLIEDGTFVEEGQTVCILDCQPVRTNFDQVTLALENAEIGLIKTRADMNMQLALLEAQVKTNEADTKIAQMDSLQLAFSTEKQKSITELDLEKATINKVRYENKLKALKVIQQSDIKRIELEIQQLKKRFDIIQEMLDGLTIKAPQSGLVLLSNGPTGKTYQVGDNLWSRRTVATIPEISKMKVKILATESDFKNISVNDSVSYTFNAMPGNVGTGKILKKSPMGQPYKNGSAVKFFEIEASIDGVLTMPEPGFTVNCHIFFKQSENVISIPQIALFDDDSMKVVFIQGKKGFEKRQVLTGLSSPREAVITAGLEDGEIIALSKPKPSMVKALVALPDSLINTPVAPDETPLAPVQGLPPGMSPPLPPNIVRPIISNSQ